MLDENKQYLHGMSEQWIYSRRICSITIVSFSAYK